MAERIPLAFRNVQLGEKERTCVYISRDTGRILGFGHESIKFVLPPGTQGVKREVLYHAADIERYAERYRVEQQQDFEQDRYNQILRESPIRDAIHRALRARRNAVTNPLDRAYIDVNLKLMDKRAEWARNRQQECMLLSEKYDADKTQEEIALDSPAFKADWGSASGSSGTREEILKLTREILNES